MLGLGNSLVNSSVSSSVGSWAPSDELKLVAWYQYQTGITTIGPEVSQWDNSVPITNPNFGLYHLTQTGTSAPQTRPDYLVSGVISFNGLGDCLNVTGSINLTGDFTIGFKIKNAATNVCIYGSTSFYGEFLRFSNNTNIKVIIDSAITLDFPILNNLNLLAYYTLSRQGNDYYLTQNGGGLISPNTPPPTPPLIVNIDAIGVRKINNNFYKGEMSEIQIYKSSNQTLINNVNTRLASL